MHRLLEDPQLAPFAALLGTGTLKSTVTDVLGEARRAVADQAGSAPPYENLVARIALKLAQQEAQGLVPVLNASGILLHTNLGRAPLADEALAAINAIGAGYSNLEFDVDSGTRGSRYDRVTELLGETTGAADGLLVNNCAAAILLVLDTFAKGREVIVARNGLIEIGGGFRLPDVVTRSGARLVEVGTTNKTYLHDFERALTVDTALLLRSHASNFRLSGFIADVTASELSELGRRAGIPSFEDLGTGALVDISAYGLPRERTVREAIAEGVDLVAFSGDKLLGGPQAGMIVGTRAAVARLRSNPLLRALRVDKATLAAAGATLRLYTLPGGLERIPLYAMLAQKVTTLRDRAERIRAALGSAGACATVVDTAGYVGGGTLPDVHVPSAGLALAPPAGDAGRLATRLRHGRPIVVGRVEDRALILDLRTIPASGDERLTGALARALGGSA